MAREDAVIVNALVRQALTAAQEVMGENGLNAVLRTSGREFDVTETSCRALGAQACEFQVKTGA